MSNQTNIYLVEARALFERDAREVELQQPANLLKPLTYMPLLQWIRLEFERAEDEGEYDDAVDELEELLLFDGDSGFGSPGIDFATQFDAGWALIEDLQTLAPFIGVPLRNRLADEDIIDGAGFPKGLNTSSPLRLLDLPGWQFFDRSEVESMLIAVREALEQEKEILNEDEWRASRRLENEELRFRAFLVGHLESLPSWWSVASS
jgi:hypothetical protein